MSKQGKRKITVELPKAKDLSNRPSVFERLGTKKAAAAKKASESCRQWAQHGTCPYGKTCKFASTHTLISPSKQRAAIKDSSEIKRTLIKDDAKSRLHSTVVVRSGRTPEPEWDNWDQNDLEYADADVLEKRRQQLQRELEIQLKMDTGNRKEKKKTVPSSSSSSRSSSTTSVSSSTSGGSSSSSSSPRDSRKKVRKAKSKRNSSSSSGSEHVSKKKRSKTESLKRDKSASCKRSSLKKDVGRVAKKHEVAATKKKVTAKTALSKKSLSPAKKAGGTPPINNKNIPKGYILNKHNTHSKSPTKKDKNRSPSSHSTKEREKDKEREREKERDRLKEKEREREKERDKEREREREKERRRSKSPRSKGRSRSPVRRHGSHPPRDPRRKDSPTRSRGSSPKGRAARDNNSDKHRSKTSPARDDRKDDKRKDKDLKDRSLERRKDKHDEKDRHDRLRKDRDHQRDDTRLHREKEREEALARCQERQRERERLKDQTKREQEAKRNRERDRRINENKGLEKPTPDKPVERLLPRPEERLAALAATNRNIGLERAISTNRERSEARTERSSRKGDRSVDRDRIDRLPKRQSDRRSSMDRVDRNEYSRNMDRSYDHSHSMDRSYDRPNERYDDLVPLDRERERSPGAFPVQSRERDLHYDSPYDIQGSHSRGYVDPDERGYDDHLDDHHAVDRGFIDDGRTRDCGRRDDHSWEGRETSVDQERQYIHHSHAQHGHPHKEWENEDYHGDWNRQDRHWQHRDPQHQVMDWSDKERDVDSTWHSHRQPTGSTNASRNRLHDDGNYRGRMDHGRMETNQHLHSMTNKRNLGNRDAPPDISDAKKAPSMNPQTSGPTHAHSAQTAHPSAETEDPIPDDLSEISDDPDEILNRDDEISAVTEPAVTASVPPDTQNSLDPYGMIGLQPFRPDYEPMMEHDVEKPAPKQTSVDTSSQKSEISTGCQENSNAAPPVENKVDQTQEPDPEDTLDNLGFEEISDGELEEDQRVKGLGDALGVDWASLVAEVQGKKEKGLAENGDKKEQSGARQYWQPQKVLARIGVSLYMAGENMIKEIFSDKTTVVKTEDGLKSTDVNVKQEEFKLSHPVASIQVAIERRKQQRLSLFGTGTGFTRALCARQDLALRRHLCNLPINESAHEIHPPDPQLFAMAQKLIQKTS